MNNVDIEIIRIGDHTLPSPYRQFGDQRDADPMLHFRAYRMHVLNQIGHIVRSDLTDWRTLDAVGIKIPPRQRIMVDTGFSVLHAEHCRYENIPVTTFGVGMIIPTIQFRIVKNPITGSSTGDFIRNHSVLIELLNMSDIYDRGLHCGDAVACIRLYARIRMRLKTPEPEM
jgi:hypothetical protein